MNLFIIEKNNCFKKRVAQIVIINSLMAYITKIDNFKSNNKFVMFMISVILVHYQIFPIHNV